MNAKKGKQAKEPKTVRTKREEHQDEQTISDGEPAEAETKIRTETGRWKHGAVEVDEEGKKKS